MIDTFEQESIRVKPESKMLLALDDDSRIWLVRSGQVDIFAVLTASGEPGARVHLFQAGEGELLFGVSPTLQQEVSLLVVGHSGCEILGLELGRFKEMACSKYTVDPLFEKALEAWVTALSIGVCNRNFTQDFPISGAGKRNLGGGRGEHPK